MRYLKLFEDYYSDYSEDLPYVQISISDFSEVHNEPHKMIKLDDYDFNFLNRFIKTIPNSLIERKEDKRLTANQEGIWYFEHIEISFSNIRYSHIRVYKTETNFYTQIIEPISNKDNNWEFNHYKLDDIYDVVLFIKDKLKLYYSLTESVEYEDYEVEDYQPIRKIDSGLHNLKYSVLDDESADYIKNFLIKLFNHSKFTFRKINNYEYEVYENVNSRFYCKITSLEDDYYLLVSGVGLLICDVVGLFICDGFFNLFKKIKADFYYIKTKSPEMYMQSQLFNMRAYPEIDTEVQQFIQSKIKAIYPDLDVEILTKSEPSLFGDKYRKVLILKKDGKKVAEIIKGKNEENISGEVDINFTSYYINFLKRISSITWRCYGIKGLIEVIGDKLYSTEEIVKDKIESGKSIDAKELKLLNDADKKKWLDKMFTQSPSFNLNDTEFKVLNDDLIKFYIDLLFEKGKGFLTKRQFASLPDEMKLYFIKLKGKTRLRDDQKKWLEERK